MSRMLKKVEYRVINDAAKRGLETFNRDGRHNHTELKPIAESVKTRRKSLVCKELYLQMAGQDVEYDFGINGVKQ